MQENDPLFRIADALEVLAVTFVHMLRHDLSSEGLEHYPGHKDDNAAAVQWAKELLEDLRTDGPQ